MKSLITVSVAYAERDEQWVAEFQVARGSSVDEVVAASGALEEVPALVGKTVTELDLGIFAKPVSADALVEEGDRIEIYRPLTADPKEVRRQLAKLGKTMGSQKRS